MTELKSIFTNHGGSLDGFPKYALLRSFYEDVDQDHGIDAMVCFSVLRCLKAKESVDIESKLVEVFAETYREVYLPMFVYYADELKRLVESNSLNGEVVFVLRDAGKLADVACDRYPEGTEFGDRVKVGFIPRTVTSDESVAAIGYQKEVLGGACVIADTGLYSIQALSYQTGKDSLHFKKTGAYWGGPENIENIPQELLDGLFNGKQLLPIFLVSGTHWENSFQIPGVLNKLVYDNKEAIINSARESGAKIEPGSEEAFLRMTMSLVLDCVERLMPSPYKAGTSLDKDTGELVVNNNESELVQKILASYSKVRQQEFQIVHEKDSEKVKMNALGAMGKFVELSVQACKTGVFTGVLPIGVPGKYVGNESVIIDQVSKGGKQEFDKTMSTLVFGNSLLVPPVGDISDLPLPDAEAKAAEKLFEGFEWP